MYEVTNALQSNLAEVDERLKTSKHRMSETNMQHASVINEPVLPKGALNANASSGTPWAFLACMKAMCVIRIDIHASRPNMDTRLTK